MRAFSFALTFVCLFVLTYIFLGMVDALPEPRTSHTGAIQTEPEDIPMGTRELPTRVVIKDVGIDWKVLNPTATDLDTLNTAVDEAPMRWPTSGLLRSEEHTSELQSQSN